MNGSKAERAQSTNNLPGRNKDMSKVILYNNECIQSMEDIENGTINLILTEIIIPSLIQGMGKIKKCALAV